MDNVLEKINRAGLKLLEAQSPEETYTAIVTEAMRLVSAESGSIFLEKNETLERVFSSDTELFKTEIRRKGYVFNAFKTRKPMVVKMDKIEKVHPHLKSLGIQSTIFIPLSYRSEAIGVLTLNSLKNEHFSSNELEILTLFGSMASLAIKRAQQFVETKKALEIRDMFIAMAAHELRTPLTSISGYIQLLYSKLANREGVEGKWIQELYEENKRMTTLVKEILEVNRLKTGQIQLMWQECNVSEILYRSLDDMRKSYNDREIVLEDKLKEQNGTVIGDANKLEKVFTNVIDNALKYSSKDSKVLVIITQQPGFVSIKVKDTGKGIDPKDLPHIFEGHHRGDSGEEGMGIGLFFVESVMRQHKGVINVKSKLKKGSTFEIKLPKSKL